MVQRLFGFNSVNVHIYPDYILIFIKKKKKAQKFCRIGTYSVDGWVLDVLGSPGLCYLQVRLKSRRGECPIPSGQAEIEGKPSPWIL